MPHDEVTIIIEKKQHKSPNPTSGAALYTLGAVPAGYDLFQEVPGPGDDIRVSNDNTELTLKNGTHFYFAKQTLNPGNA